MPGWHAAIRDRVEDGSIQEVGIILEQHPDRCRLFMQWKELDFPILVDSMNLMGAPLVPLSYLVDESGRVVELAGRPGSIDEFLARPPVEWSPAPPVSAPDLAALRQRTDSDDADAMVRLGSALLLWGAEAHLDAAVGTLRKASNLAPERGDLLFRLGVAHRARFESAQTRADDFANAVGAWEAALETDPNQYIWRRRIQQYGPRLDKPYPFYDWVHAARAAIRDRGEDPVPLRVEPTGAEIALPARGGARETTTENPDPDGRILRDEEGFVRIDSVVVPHTGGVSRGFRVHLELRLNEKLDAHWNNEGGGVEVWIDPPDGWNASPRLSSYVERDRAVSADPRHLEIELVPVETGAEGPGRFRAYALYYVCEGETGVCLYRRQDFELGAGFE